MKKTILKIVLSLSFLLICAFAKINAQNNYEDVIYLKNGSIVRGVILEQVINVSVKIQTADRNIFVYKMDEVEKITKELMPDKKTDVSVKTEITTSNGHEFKQGNKNLLKEEVAIILRDSKNGIAYEYWTDGQRKMRAGNTLSWIGTPMMIIGAAAGIGFSIDGALPPLIIMCVATPIGAGFLISGVSVKSSGRKKVIKSIDTYNSSINTSSLKPKINLTVGLSKSVPGIGLYLNF